MIFQNNILNLLLLLCLFKVFYNRVETFDEDAVHHNALDISEHANALKDVPEMPFVSMQTMENFKPHFMYPLNVDEPSIQNKPFDVSKPLSLNDPTKMKFEIGPFEVIPNYEYFVNNHYVQGKYGIQSIAKPSVA